MYCAVVAMGASLIRLIANMIRFLYSKFKPKEKPRHSLKPIYETKDEE